MWYGLTMDLAMASYLAVIPCLLVAALVRDRPRPLVWVIVPYTVLLITVIALLTAVDLETFAEWGHRLDGRLVLYLATPREMMASASAAPVPLLTGIFLGLVLAGFAAVRLILVPRIRTLLPAGVLASCTVLVLIAPLIIAIGGGTRQIPLNESRVYFSLDDFANQAALNVPWYFVDSLYWDTYGKTNLFAALPPTRPLASSTI